MNTNSRRLITVCPTLLLLLVLGNLASICLNTYRLHYTTALIRRSRLIAIELEHVLGAVSEVRRNQREYLLTTDPACRTGFEQQAVEIGKHMVELREVVHGSSRTQAIELQKLIDIRITLLRENMAIRDRDGLDASVKRIRSGVGPAYTAAITKLIGEMSTGEHRLLDRRLATAARIERETIASSSVVSVAAIGLWVAVMLVKRREDMSVESELVAQGWLASIINSSDAAIISRTIRGIITTWNVGAERIFGYTSAEIVGSRGTSIIPRELWRDMAILMKRLHQGEHIDYIESVRLTRDQKRLDVALTISPIFDKTGAVVGMSEIIRDITEQKRVSDALIESRHRFDRFMRAFPGAAWIKDANGHYVYANDTAVKLFGVARDDLYGKTDFEVFTRAIATQFAQNDKTVIDSNASLQTIETLLYQGEPMYSLVNKFPIPSFRTAPLLVGGIAIDITKQKTMEEELAVSEMRYTATLELLPHMVFTAAPDGGLTYTNQYGLDYAGRTMEQTKGYGWLATVPPDTIDQTVAKIRRSVQSGTSYEAELLLKHAPSQKYRWNYVKAVPLRNKSGELTGWIGITVDVDDRKRMENALRISEERFKRFMEYLPGLAWIRDLDGRCIYANAATNRIWHEIHPNTIPVSGIPPNKLDIDLFLLEEVAMFKASDQRALATGVTTDVERFTLDGVYKYYAVNKFVIPGTAPATNTIGGVAIDITEHKQMEQALRVSEARLASFLRHAPGLVWMKDRTGHYVYANDPVVAIHNTTREKLYGSTDYDTATPDAAAEWRAHDNAVLESGESVQAVETITRPGSDIIQYFAVTKFLMPGATPDQDLVGGTGIDITELKQIEQELRTSEERYRTLIDLSPQVVWSRIPSGEFTYINQYGLDYTGATADDVKGRKWLNYVDEPCRARVLDRWRDIAKAGVAYEEEIPLWHAATQTYRWNYSRGVPVRDEAGEITRWVGITLDVDDRRRAEQELRASEDRYRILTNVSPQIVWTAKCDGSIDYVNPYGIEYIGLSIEQLVGAGWLGAVHPTHRERVFTEWVHATATGEYYETEYPLYHAASNGYRWQFIKSVAARSIDNPAVITHWVGTCVDVDDKKHAEQELLASEERYRILTSASPQIVWVSLPDSTMTYLNPFGEEYTGATKEQLSGSGWLDVVVHPVYRGVVAAAWQNAMITGEYYEIEFPLLRAKDHAYRWNLAKAVPVRDTTTQVISQWIGTCLDIDDKKHTEVKFATVVESAPNGIILMNCADGRVKLVNAQLEKWFGYDRSEVIDQPIEMLIPERYVAAHAEQRQRYCNDPSIFPAGTVRCVTARHKDGSEFPLEIGLNTANILDEPLVLAVVTDITERKAAEARLHQALADAADANRAKDSFLAMVSHELRTPLTPVLAITTALLETPNLDRTIYDDLAVIKDNVEVETRLIGDVLDLTRALKGKLEVHLETVNATAIIGSAIKTLRPEDRSKHLEFRSEIAPGPHYVRADPIRLSQILWNLIGNAVKYTPDGGIITVRVAPDQQGRLVTQVIDTGIGIEPELIEKLFNPFEQGQRILVNGRGGLGLGLYISRTLAESMDGTLTVSSAGANQGSTFTLIFNTVPAPAFIPPSPRPTAAPAQVAGCTVLLVEDHQKTRETLIRLLTNRGYKVLPADSVKSALRTAQTSKFDVLLSDIGLPDGSGLDIMRKLKPMGVRGISLSGFGEADDVAKSLEAGFITHLVKPASIQVINAELQRVYASG